jgi:hypothetical protein
MDRKLDIDYLPIEGDTTDPIQKIMNNIDAQLAEMKNLIDSTYGVKVGAIVDQPASVAELAPASVTTNLESTVLMGELADDEPVAEVVSITSAPSYNHEPEYVSDDTEVMATVAPLTREKPEIDESWLRPDEAAEAATVVIPKQETVVQREKQSRSRKWLGRVATVAAFVGAASALSAMPNGGYAEHRGDMTAGAAYEAPVIPGNNAEAVAPTLDPVAEAIANASDEETVTEWAAKNGMAMDTDQLRQAVEVARAAGVDIAEKPTADGEHFYLEADATAVGGDVHETRTSKLAKLFGKYFAQVRGR